MAGVRGLVAALRSGSYPQGFKYLNKDGKMCCLGVACEVAIAGGLELKREKRNANDKVAYVQGFWSSATVLPTPVISWFGFDGLGMSTENPYLLIPEALKVKYADRLIAGRGDATLGQVWTPTFKLAATEFNDEFRFTLPEIADCFELTFLPDDWAARAAAAS